jgi:hypothetical protein
LDFRTTNSPIWLGNFIDGQSLEGEWFGKRKEFLQQLAGTEVT